MRLFLMRNNYAAYFVVHSRAVSSNLARSLANSACTFELKGHPIEGSLSKLIIKSIICCIVYEDFEIKLEKQQQILPSGLIVG